MWDTATIAREQHLSHDLPCRYCGHAPHRYLPCDRACGCAAGVDAADQR